MSCCGGAQVEDELGQRYRIDRVLGKGKFAVVKACTDRSTGAAAARSGQRRNCSRAFVLTPSAAECCADAGLPYAVKMIFKESVSKIQSFELRTEVEILRKLDHPNIIKVRKLHSICSRGPATAATSTSVCMTAPSALVALQLHDVFETSTHLHLVIELATGGELFDRIISKGYYSENDAARVVMQLASALQYMHSHGVTHRDLKPENLLYARPDSSALIKITDFGLAKLSTADDVMRSAVGTPGYVAPEVISGSAYGPEVDVWSLGVILYIMLCGFAPFNDSDLPGLFHKILRADYSFPSPGVWDSISDGVLCCAGSQPLYIGGERSIPTSLASPWMLRVQVPRTWCARCSSSTRPSASRSGR